MSDITTVVGEQTVIKGNLQGDEDLTVFGKIEGGINLTKTLIVERSGIVVADIEIRDAIISGVVVGNVTATNSVHITEEGRMVGDIASPRVIIVDGASFKGHVDMGNLEGPPLERPAPPVRPAARVTRSPALTERSAVPPRRPAAAEPPPERPAPRPTPAPAKPKPKPPTKSKAKPKAPTKPAAPKAKSKSKAKKKATRKPPRPPKMPAGKRKVKRR